MSFCIKNKYISKNCNFLILEIFALRSIIDLNFANIKFESIVLENQKLDNFLYFITTINLSQVSIIKFRCKNNSFPKNSLFAFFDSNIFLQNLIFESNEISSNYSGNIIYAVNDCLYVNFELYDSIFTGNFIKSEAFLLDGFKSIFIHNSDFQMNYFLMLFFILNTQNCSIYNTTFVGNNDFKSLAEDEDYFIFGGTIKLEHIAELSFTFIYIGESYSENAFVGVYLINVNQTKILDCFFKENIGNFSVSSERNLNYSVVLYLYNDNFDTKIKIDRSIFVSNQLILDNPSRGSPCGTILLPEGTIKIKNSVFQSNLASDYTICLELKSNTIFINNTLFNQNEPIINKDGGRNEIISGAITCDFKNFILLSSNFTFNQAGTGTGILLNDESLYTSQNFYGSDLKFIQNIAFSSSNALHVTADFTNRNFTFRNSFFLKVKVWKIVVCSSSKQQQEILYKITIFLIVSFLKM